MVKWEYKVVRYVEDYLEDVLGVSTKGMFTSQIIEKALNSLGQEGWEFVDFQAAWIFKRPVQEEDRL